MGDESSLGSCQARPSLTRSRVPASMCTNSFAFAGTVGNPGQPDFRLILDEDNVGGDRAERSVTPRNSLNSRPLMSSLIPAKRDRAQAQTSRLALVVDCDRRCAAFAAAASSALIPAGQGTGSGANVSLSIVLAGTGNGAFAAAAVPPKHGMCALVAAALPTAHSEVACHERSRGCLGGKEIPSNERPSRQRR